VNIEKPGCKQIFENIHRKYFWFCCTKIQWWILSYTSLYNM